jgi:hypothetical protein
MNNTDNLNVEITFTTTLPKYTYWKLERDEVKVYVVQTLCLGDTSWKISYPDSRYSTPAPPLTAEQLNQVYKFRSAIETVWKDESKIVDSMVKVLSPVWYNAGSIDVCRGNITLKYYDLAPPDCRFDLTLLLCATHTHYGIKVCGSLVMDIDDHENHISAEVLRVDIPIKGDGTLDLTSLSEGLRNSYFQQITTTLSQSPDWL